MTGRGWSGLSAPAVNRMIDASVFSGAPDNAMVGAIMLSDGVAQRTAAAGLRPPPLAVLIEGAPCSVNAFPDPGGREALMERTHKVLMRLNFRGCAANG